MYRPLREAGPAPAAPVEGRVASTSLRRVGGAATADLVALEEPLEVRLAGEPIAVLMRTPGDDARLALGFLYSEGLVDGAAGLTGIHRPAGRDGAGPLDAIDVVPAPGARAALARLRAAAGDRIQGGLRAPGPCGRRAVGELAAPPSGLPPPEPIDPVPAAFVGEKVDALRDHQPIFAATGATHVAALWTREGALVAVHEDIGRHNAVDKVLGALLLARAEATPARPAPAPALLTVSSRAGSEVVQKAARARIPILATVSAPTSLGVALARAAGLTLAGFVRAGRMNVYTGAERIVF